MTYEEKSTASAPSLSIVPRQENPDPEENLTFKPWSAARVIEARVKCTAQLVGIQLARRSTRNGVADISLEQLAKITGFTAKTVGRAMEDLVKADLLRKRRTRDGYVYTWAREAYCPADVAAGLDKAYLQAGDLPWSAISQKQVEEMVVRLYLEQGQKRYNIHPESPQAQAKTKIASGLMKAIVDELLFAAQKRLADADNPLDALAQTTRAVLRLWFTWEGEKKDHTETQGYLVKYNHPLGALAKDIGKVVAKVMATKPWKEAPVEPARLSEESIAAYREQSELAPIPCETCGAQSTRIWGQGTEMLRYACGSLECSPHAERVVPVKYEIVEHPVVRQAPAEPASAPLVEASATTREVLALIARHNHLEKLAKNKGLGDMLIDLANEAGMFTDELAAAIDKAATAIAEDGITRENRQVTAILRAVREAAAETKLRNKALGTVADVEGDENATSSTVMVPVIVPQQQRAAANFAA